MIFTYIKLLSLLDRSLLISNELYQLITMSFQAGHILEQELQD